MRPGIVHLGVGAFHRAHQAAYTDAVLAAGDGRWGITAASLRSPDTRDALAPQDGLYALSLCGETDRLVVIGSIGWVERHDPAYDHPVEQVAGRHQAQLYCRH